MNLSDEPSNGEFEVIERLRTRLPAAPAGELWLGDDAAVIGGGWLVTSDALVLGIDWDPALSAPDDVGWKAAMVNASDLAAMGARAERMVVTLVAPSGFEIDEFYDGFTAACDELGAAVVGGDLSAPPPMSDLVVVSVTALGRCPDGPPVTRSGARAGERLWVSGELGAAAAGLRMLRAGGDVDDACARAHRRPVAEVDKGVAAAAAGATAMIDVSDGLAADAWHLAVASGLALAIDDLPIAGGATEDEAIAGGDDYALLCTAPARAQLDGWVRIGTCEAGEPIVTLRGQALDARGYQHWRRA